MPQETRRHLGTDKCYDACQNQALQPMPLGNQLLPPRSLLSQSNYQNTLDAAYEGFG